MNIKNIILRKIDSTTMYQIMVWSLGLIIVAAFFLSLIGLIYYKPLEMIASLAAILASSLIFHKLFSWFFKAPANIESTYITALILFLIFDPVASLVGLLGLVAASFFAVATKYVLAINNLHILNPAAISAVLVGLFGLSYATWWVGNPYLLPLVLLTGLVITHKIRRFGLVVSGIVTALLVSIFNTGSVDLPSLYSFFAVWPILFFAFFMLTEPLSTPGTKRQRIIYGALAGGLSSLTFSLGPVFGLTLYSTPELALVMANILAFPFMLKGRIAAPLLEKKEVAKDTYEFVFKKPRFLKFKAGQYLEWSLPHKNSDSRGISRYFTIASAPTEDEIKLGVKIADQRSSFKDKLLEMKEGDKIYAASLSGDFIVSDKNSPLVFIAGGIGVTPFRSMIKEFIEIEEQKNILMFFCNRDAQSISYKDIWEEAKLKIGMKLVNVLEDPAGQEDAEKGYLNKDILEKYNVSKEDTIFYISGPTGMVNAYKKMLIDWGASSKNIKTDYFPGLA